MRLASLTGLLLVTMGCAGPVAELWPPAPASPAHDIIVSVDTWHAVIGFPTEEKGRERPQPSRLIYEEWGYAEEAWYLEGRHGITGVLRALFWPSSGVIEVGFHRRPWSQRTPDSPAEQFRFRLSETGYLRLRQYLSASRASDTPIRSSDGSKFYPAEHSYTVFHTCHHYAARALREAGLPVSSFWALTRGMFAGQLRRAEQLASQSRPTHASDSARP